MSIKYSIQYQDTVNITHRFELYDDAYAGAEIEIQGTVFLDYAETKDPLESIRGSGLRVELEANTSLTFNDLYTEEERSFQVIYKRDSLVKFNGWLNPEGWFENFVTDKWKVGFDCVDGLGFLENLSYVDDNGLFFVGKQDMLTIVSNCLKRTGVEQNINTNVDVYYTGLSTSLDILPNTYINVSRFVREDDSTIMSCEDVLRSILELYGACITSKDGEWFIYKPNQLFLSQTMTYFRYDFLGVALSPTTETLNTTFSLGSDVDGFDPHHCSANQSISNIKSIGAYRINFKYGLVNTFLSNSTLVNIAGVIADWTILDATKLAYQVDDAGVILSPADTAIVMRSDNIPVVTNDIINVRFKFRLVDDAVTFQAKMILDDGVTKYYANRNGEWSTTDRFILVGSGELVSLPLDPIELIGKNIEEIENIETDVLPVSGNLYVELWTPDWENPTSSDIGEAFVNEVFIAPLENKNDPKKGEFHTFQRTTKPSSKIESTKEIFNADNPSATYTGTIFQTDESTTTKTWSRKGFTEDIKILQIMGEETLRMSANTARIFSGDVFGFFEYLSTVTINGFIGFYVPVSYRYDTKANIISVTFTQIYGSELADIDYEVTFDYDNVVKPTIRG